MDKILFIDDDINLLASFQRQLRKRFNIDIASSGEEGLAAIKEKGPYAVIISDLMMPGMDGFEFIASARNLTHETVYIMLTGHANLDASLKALNEGNVFKFLTKPCKIQELEKVLQDCIEQYHKNTQITQLVADERHRCKVLIVDDDPEILSLFSAALNVETQFDVLTAENGQVALNILNLMKINMVIADREMPEMDGITLLQSIHKSDPDIITFLMTWQLTADIEKKISGIDIGGFFEKPLDMPHIITIIKERMHIGPRGQIDGINTAAFLQMIAMEEKTCTLQVRSNKGKGLLFFQKGKLIDAETDQLQNEDAAYEIINWKDVAIEIEHANRKKEPKINRPLVHILMEAARRQDEIIFKED